MAQQIINHGTTPGDGTGEELFYAHQKTNSNFSELFGNDADLLANAARRDQDNNFTGKRLLNFLGDIATSTVTSNAVTLQLSDTGGIREIDNANPVTVTLAASMPKGYAVTLVQRNAAGPLVWQAGSGATVTPGWSSIGHTRTAGLGAHLFAYVRANTNGSSAAWVVIGDTAV